MEDTAPVVEVSLGRRGSLVAMKLGIIRCMAGFLVIEMGSS